MNAEIKIKEQVFTVDFSKPLDISIPLHLVDKKNEVNAFGAPAAKAEPLRAGDFVGSTREGSPVNFYNVFFNPHGNGTHTECVGHISKEIFSINRQLKKFITTAQLISIAPEKAENGDDAITKRQLERLEINWDFEALIVRTLPNSSEKLAKNYSGQNPPYFEPGALAFLIDKNILHLLVDLPSVDREEDGGKLAAHKAFWNYPEATRTNATITELIYVSDEIRDGFYLLNLQIAPFEIDASPSKPILYALKRK